MTGLPLVWKGPGTKLGVNWSTFCLENRRSSPPPPHIQHQIHSGGPGRLLGTGLLFGTLKYYSLYHCPGVSELTAFRYGEWTVNRRQLLGASAFLSGKQTTNIGPSERGWHPARGRRRGGGGGGHAGIISPWKSSEGENLATLANPKSYTASRTHCTANTPRFSPPENHLAEVVRSKPGRRIYGENGTYPPILAFLGLFAYPTPRG